MATLQKSIPASVSCVLQPGPAWPWTIPNQSAAEDADVVQGRIFWLPVEEDLPKGAVERVHSKGFVEGVYGHPVVIVSRPAVDSHTADFQIVKFFFRRFSDAANMPKISSLQRKTIGGLYHITANDFHISRRAGHIPITQSSKRSCANSKTTMKQLPTLRLVKGARLPPDSYVDVWNVYKIDWSLLKVYTNPETSNVNQFRFGHKSTRRLLARTTILTKYEPGTQHQTQSMQDPERTNSWSDIAHTMPVLQKSVSEPVWISAKGAPTIRARRFSDSETRSVTSWRCCGAGSSRTSLWSSDDVQKSGGNPPSKASSDIAGETAAYSPVTWVIRHPLDCLFKRGVAGCRSSRMTRINPRKREKSQLWVNAKGAMAVIVASI